MGKPKIRFKGYNDEWEQRKLSDIAVLTSSKRVHAEDYVETGVPFYRGKEISELKEHKPISEVLYITEYKYNEISSMYGSPKEGDLLITAVGTLGNTWVIDQTPFYFKDGNLIWFKDIKCNPKYLDYAMSTADGQKKILASAIGSNQKALTMVKLNELEFMFPGKAEQDKIAEYFSYLDNLITLHQRKCDEMKILKKYMLQKMFPQNGQKIPEIRFEGFTGEWEQRKLGELASSFEYGLNAAAKEYDEENKYIRITDIDDNTHEFLTDNLTSPDIELTGADNYKLTEGDILFARTGASVGKSYIYKNSDGLVYYAGFLIRARIKEEYDAEFVFQNTLTDRYNKYIAVTSQRSGQPGVNAQEYAEFEIKVPKKEEQTKIGTYFRNIDRLITLHQRKCNELKNIKKFMLQNMFV